MWCVCICCECEFLLNHLKWYIHDFVYVHVKIYGRSAIGAMWNREPEKLNGTDEVNGEMAYKRSW